MSDETLIEIDASTLVVSFSPSSYGDAVTARFTDTFSGQRYMLAATPEVTEYLADLLATALKHPGVKAAADQIRAARR